jgi:2-phosphosulfolactate phosphatase
VIVVVDVLSFTTSVDVATARGARVHVCRDEAAGRELAERTGAELSGQRGSGTRYTLSPHSLLGVPNGTRLVLPSLNGSALSARIGSTPTLAGCLRNAAAVARAATEQGARIAVIPSGERWPDGSLRPCVEDWLGAGAVLSHLSGSPSPEARAARAAFQDARAELDSVLWESGSGKELRERGFSEDVALAAELDVSACAPHLEAGAYVAREVPEKLASQGLEIRPYRESDQAGIVALWDIAFPGSPPHNSTLSDIERKLRVQRDLFLVASQQGRVVGSVMAGFDGHRGWVYYLATLPDLRGRGIGRALMEAAEQALRRRGCTKLNLQVRDTNLAVITFYEKLGYAVEERASLAKRLV